MKKNEEHYEDCCDCPFYSSRRQLGITAIGVRLANFFLMMPNGLTTEPKAFL